MIKTFKILALTICLAFLAISGNIFVHANAPKAEIFSGIDGKKISVYTNRTFSEQKNSSAEIRSVKAGDVIEVNDLQEIVIGVSDDGRFLTMPLEDYLLEQKNG